MHGYEGGLKMDRLEKRIDEKIDSKLGLVMDRLSGAGENQQQHEKRSLLFV